MILYHVRKVGTRSTMTRGPHLRGAIVHGGNRYCGRRVEWCRVGPDLVKSSTGTAAGMKRRRGCALSLVILGRPWERRNSCDNEITEESRRISQLGHRRERSKRCSLRKWGKGTQGRQLQHESPNSPKRSTKAQLSSPIQWSEKGEGSPSLPSAGKSDPNHIER